MSDHFHDATNPIARRGHRCTGCAAPIAVGEKYHRQTGIFEGSYFVNKLHVECLEALQADSDGGNYEFSPGELEPPARLMEISDGTR